MKKIALILIAFVLLILVIKLPLFHHQMPAMQTAQLAQVSLRLKWLYDPGFAGEMVAAKEGIFRKNGLAVDIRPGGFEADPIKLVASGSDTFGVTGGDSFLLARDNGVPIVAFAAGYIQTPVVYYSMKSANIHSPSDWKGKKIGVQAGQDTETIFRALLTKAGLSDRDVTEVPEKFDFSQFLNGAVDIWPGYAATQSYILHTKNIPYDTVSASDNGINYVGTVYFTTETIMKNHPEWVAAFLKSIIEGWQTTYTNESLAVSDIASYDPKSLTPDLIRWNLEQQKESILPPGRRYCEFSAVDFEAMQQLLLKQHILKAPIDLSNAINTNFLKEYYNQ